MRKITGGLLPVDIWKDYMLDAHKDLPFTAISAPEPAIDDDRAKLLSDFYVGLSDALVSERDMAARGSGSPTTAGR